MKNLKLFITITIIILTAGCSKKSIEERTSDVEKLLKEKQYQLAVVESKSILQEDLTNISVRLLLAHSYLEQGLFEEAESEFYKALEYKADLNTVITPLIESLYGSYDFLGIIKTWEKYNSELTVIEKAKASAIASLALLQEKGIEEGKQLIQQSILWGQEAGNQDTLLISNTILSLYQKDSTKLSRAENLTTACEAQPKHWIICLLSANSLAANKKYLQSSIKLEELITQKPFYYQPILTLAENYIKLDDKNKADFYLNKMLKLFPRQPKINQLKALQLVKNKQFEEAIPYINTANASNIKNNELQLISGLTHYQLGNYEQAANYLTSLNKELPNNPYVKKLLVATELKLGNNVSVYNHLKTGESANNIEMIAAVGIELLKSGEIEKSQALLKDINTNEIQDLNILKQVGISKLILGDQEGVEDLAAIVDSLEKHNSTTEELGKGKFLYISSLLSTDQHDKAKKEAQNWIDESPDSIENYLLLAEIEKRSSPQDTKKIEALYQKAYTLDNNNLDANIYFAEKAFEAKDYETALTFYKNAMSVNITNFKVVLGFYQTSELLGREEQAIESIEIKLSSNKREPKYVLLLAQLYLTANTPLKAIDHLKDVTFSDIKARNTRNLLLGDANLALGNYQEAILAYNSVEMIRQINLSVVSKKLIAQEKLGKLPQAVEDLTALSRRFPENQIVKLLLANYQVLTNQPDLALEYLSTLTEEQQAIPLSVKIKGMALHRKEQYDDAYEYLKKSYDQNNDPLVATMLYDSLIKLNSDAAATIFMEKHLQVSPGDYRSRLLFSSNLAKTDKDKAITHLKIVVEQQKNNIIALNNLAWYLYEKNSLKEAKDYIDRAVMLAPNIKFIMDTSDAINKKLNDKA
jgi:cellulose synthase operon protein C